MNKYYHFTKRVNLKEIEESEILRGPVFVCTTKNDIYKFLAGKYDADYVIKNIVILEFLSDAKFEKSYDHNAKYFDSAKALYSVEDIKIENAKYSWFNKDGADGTEN